jgi:Uma2 family endonuclease
MTWQEVLSHPSLQDLPFKIELNGQGVIEMSPATNWHGLYQQEIGRLLVSLLPHGRTISEASVQTSDGVRVADVVWATHEYISQNKHQTPFMVAPPICVEIVSPSNSRKEMQRKQNLYLEAGATEVWFCTLEGELSFFDANGQLEQSSLAINFPQRIDI